MSGNIVISKVSDIECAQVGDIVKFISFIINNGDSNIDNIIFIDKPPKYTCFIPSTFRINNQLFKNINPKEPINIFQLLPNIFPIYPGDSIVIQYSVVIESCPTSNSIESTSTVNTILDIENKYYFSNTNVIRIKDICINS